MSDSYSEFIKLLLPEIIVEYFELICYEKAEEVLPLDLKELNSIPKEYGQHKLSSKGFLRRYPLRIDQSVDIRYTCTSPAEDGLMKILGK